MSIIKISNKKHHLFTIDCVDFKIKDTFIVNVYISLNMAYFSSTFPLEEVERIDKCRVDNLCSLGRQSHHP